jgi:hypothetical protein
VEEAGAVAAPAEPETDEAVPETADTAEVVPAAEEETEVVAAFSPEGTKLFLRAMGALARFGGVGDDGDDGAVKAEPKSEAKNKGLTKADIKDAVTGGPAPAGAAAEAAAGAAGGTEAEAAQEDEAQGKPLAVDGHQRAAATTTGQAAQPGRQPSGHFVAPTAVAVVPTTPVRRPLVEGGFDFFGAQKGAAPAALAAVQNEDLADVVGQEALALHKAESEAEFKPADAESRGVGQVIDLTAHDETEQIDVQGLRSRVS